MNPPATGVATLITHQKKILIGKRKRNGAEFWQLPGGFMQIGESPENAIKRTTLVETNLHIDNPSLIALTNNIFDYDQHTISLIFKAICLDPTKLGTNESSKCSNWYWESWDSLPLPLFLPLQTLLANQYHPFSIVKRELNQNKDNNCFIF